MDSTLRRKLIEAVAGTVIERSDELTALDQAIGDGDHGLNMKRGAEAVLTQVDALAAAPLPEALATIGKTLVMKVGGASGPLYGTFFMTLGKELPADAAAADVLHAFDAGIDALKRIGRSDAGQKTMLDVLIPVRDELASAGNRWRERLRRRAAEAATATIPMKAIKGRASFLGERSIGHMDPGARSSFLMIAAVCDVMED